MTRGERIMLYIIACILVLIWSIFLFNLHYTNTYMLLVIAAIAALTGRYKK
jgi:4-amino-4-deoxy-L-arabinose transferase-like glycosyltransferase